MWRCIPRGRYDPFYESAGLNVFVMVSITSVVLSAFFFLLCGLRGHGHVPGWTCVTGWQSWHKNSPLPNLCIKTNKWSRRKSLLKDQRPNWTHISSWNDGRFTDPADQHSLSQNRGEWGGWVMEVWGRDMWKESATCMDSKVWVPLLLQRMCQQAVFHRWWNKEKIPFTIPTLFLLWGTLSHAISLILIRQSNPFYGSDSLLVHGACGQDELFTWPQHFCQVPVCPCGSLRMRQEQSLWLASCQSQVCSNSPERNTPGESTKIALFSQTNTQPQSGKGKQIHGLTVRGVTESHNGWGSKGPMEVNQPLCSSRVT